MKWVYPRAAVQRIAMLLSNYSTYCMNSAEDDTHDVLVHIRGVLNAEFVNGRRIV